jgi:hypothetical protein
MNGIVNEEEIADLELYQALTLPVDLVIVQ